MNKNLVDLKTWKFATVVELQGGRGMRERLRKLGITEGQRVQKVSKIAFGGPVVVIVDRTQIAIGRGMARKIIVDQEEDEKAGVLQKDRRRRSI